MLETYNHQKFVFLKSDSQSKAKDVHNRVLALAMVKADGRAFTLSGPLRGGPVGPRPRRALPPRPLPLSAVRLLLIISSSDISNDAIANQTLQPYFQKYSSCNCKRKV
ncbi:hypothetical protein Hanom_Chr15g01369011 [Helianthus anomalus]